MPQENIENQNHSDNEENYKPENIQGDENVGRVGARQRVLSRRYEDNEMMMALSIGDFSPNKPENIKEQ